MDNVADKVKQHNSKILTQNETRNSLARSWNCRKKDECPLNGNCLIESVVYEATLREEGKVTQKYYGLTENFKTRYNNHKKNAIYENDTELSKLVWSLKNNGKRFKIEWKVVEKAPSHRYESRRCDLCTTGKMWIAMAIGKSQQMHQQARQTNIHVSASQ